MADDYANVTIARKMHGDRRFDLLAELGGWTRNDACWRMTELFSRCTALQTDRPPPEVIRAHLGLRGELLLLDSALGERCPDGSIRVRGGGLTGGDTDRFGWYEPVREQQREAGAKRAKSAIRGQGGRFGRAPDGTGAGPALSSGSTGAGPAEPADRQRSPAPVQPQRSEIRISEEDLSLPRDPAVPTLHRHPTTPPPGSSVPAVSPPAPAREDIAGTHEADRPVRTETGQNRPVRTPNEVEKPATGHRDVKPANPIPPAIAFDPTDPRAIGRLAEIMWRRVSDAAVTVAAGLKLPPPIPFPEITPSTNRKGFVDLKARIREEGELAPVACDAVVENTAKLARARKSIEWLSEKLFGENAWLNARNGIDPSARSGPSKAAQDLAARYGGSASSAPSRPRQPDPPLPTTSLTVEERLALAAESRVALGHERPADLPTTALHTMFGPGDTRAPPASVGPNDTPTDQPRRRKAAT